MALRNKLLLSIRHPSRSRNVFIDRNSFLLEDVLRFSGMCTGKCLMKIITEEEDGKKKFYFFVRCTEICAILKHIQSLLLFNDAV